MGDNETTPKIELDQVMLAMDVVDTLRHQQDLVDRELASDQRDQALIDKVKRMYASQGLPVTDEIIAEGVAALREDRFAYRRPPARGSLWLARLYVKRGFLAKLGAALAGLGLVVFLTYRIAYVGPEVRARLRAAQDLNTLIGQQQDQISVAQQRLASLTQALKTTRGKAPPQAQVADQRLSGEAEHALAGAETDLRAFAGLPLAPNLDADSLAREGEAVKHRLEQRANLVRGATAHLDQAEAAVTGLSELAVLPQKLTNLRTSLLAESRDEAARVRTESLYSDAMAALNQGDVQGALKAAGALQQLQEQLSQEYDLRIVSRPKTSSGVWRVPPNRPGGRNYYVIVEAVTPRGQRLTLPITSEEDGTTKNVQQWGLRVDGATFDAVRRDKLDDGIIQNNRFGVKQRGYLDPQYLMPTTGGAITRW
jgi:hypothetical protein